MKNPNTIYDVIVVGAGAAGCLFSRNLAREGYSVCLVEKRDRNKLSHDWWDGVEKSIFDKVGITHPKGDELFKGGEFIICSPLNSVQVKIPPNKNLYQIDRRKFNNRLLEEALNTGVVVFDKTMVKGPIINDQNNSIIGVSIHNSDPIKAKLIIDCSGYGGVIRSNIPFKTDFDKQIRREDTYISYVEVRNKKPSVSESYAFLLFGKQGYSAVNFNEDKYVSFFDAHADLSSIKISPKERVQALVEKYKDKCGSEIVKGGYQVPIPARRPLDSFVANGLMIIGDAACQTKPGGGIGVASSLYATKIASKVAINALEEGFTKRENLWSYNVEYHSSEHNQDYSSSDITIKDYFTMSKEVVEYVFANDLVDLSKIFGPEGEVIILKKERYKPKISVRSKILAHLAKFADSDNKVEEMKELCREYPEEYNPETFNAWREKMNNCYIVRYDLDQKSESELIIS